MMITLDYTFPAIFLILNKRQSQRDTEWTIQRHKQRWKQDTEQRQTKQTTLQVTLKDTQHGPHQKSMLPDISLHISSDLCYMHISNFLKNDFTTGKRK